LLASAAELLRGAAAEQLKISNALLKRLAVISTEATQSIAKWRHEVAVAKSIQKRTCPKPGRGISRLACGSLFTGHLSAEMTFLVLFNRANL